MTAQPIPFVQIDAFTAEPLAGNPAAVCLFDGWPDDALLARIAAENNLSETAFLVPEGGGLRIRWFTPTTEVALCGHATLAAAHAAQTEFGLGGPELVFASRSGPLTVRALGDGVYRLDFPAASCKSVTAESVRGALAAGLGLAPDEIHEAGEDLLVTLADAAAVRRVRPDFAVLARLPARGVIVTAPGESADICSRFFGPAVGVPEDPVTGSAHCALGPFWAERLGRRRLSAEQLSARGGRLSVTVADDRVFLEGPCVTVITGTLRLPASLYRSPAPSGARSG